MDNNYMRLANDLLDAARALLEVHDTHQAEAVLRSIIDLYHGTPHGRQAERLLKRIERRSAAGAA